MGFGSYTTNGSGKSKISDFVFYVVAIGLGNFLEQDILGFDVSMNKVLLVNTFESLHNLHQNLNSL
jgi:hypothetical protein